MESRPWSAQRAPASAKSSMRSVRAAATSWAVCKTRPTRALSFLMYSPKPGFSRFTALSGRKAGSTFISMSGSFAICSCQQSSSAGSSVVQTARTLN